MTLLSLVAAAQAATLTVGPTQPYTTINAAITASSSGDTIQVQAGTYAEELDLRSRTLTLVSVDGPAATVLAPTTTIQIGAGSIEGFTISPAPATAITIVSGSPSLRELEIDGPANYGVSITGGTPTVQEVGVWNAGLHSFIVTGGAPTLKRLVSYHAGNYGFAIKSGSTLKNSIAIGGAWGFVFENATTTATNIVALGASTGATAALYGSIVTNGAFLDNAVTLKCFSGATLTFTNGVAYSNATTTGCTGSPLAAVTVADPLFVNWSAGLALDHLDLHPAGGSPMVNAGTGTDGDGSVADLGAFGGSEGSWTDRDGDGTPVLFDCDDHDARTYTGATERADGKDNDCDGIIDEDIPVDTGGDDTGGPVDDTGVGDDTGGATDDTGDPSTTDLDSDGFFANTDCDEHNIATYPGAPERMDGADNDCDGAIDEGTASGDDDGDGYTELGGDCDDTRDDRHPGARDDGQLDGVDNDCDGLPDDARARDDDGDGYLDSVDDCDDTDPNSHVGAADPLDGVDNDCDGSTDEDALSRDDDADGQSSAAGDCDDSDATIYSGATDVPDDFIDQDCSGSDNYDVDRDGNAAPASGGSDCDDTRSNVYPGAPELCGDALDNNCDGAADENCDDVAPPVDDGGDCGCASSGAGAAQGFALIAAGAGVLLRHRRRDGTSYIS